MRATILLILVVTSTSGCMTGEVVGGSGELAQGKPAAVEALKQDSREVGMLYSYLIGMKAFITAAPAPDRRPPEEILKDLKALPKERKLALRAYVLATGSRLTGKSLDLMGQLLPEDHKEFLFQALESKQWGSSAVSALADLNDAKLVGPILERVNTDQVEGLAPLVRPANPAFLKALRREHAAKPTARTAFLLGYYGRLAEKEIRQTAVAADKNLRVNVLRGLSMSEGKNSLPLLLELADLSSGAESPFVVDRFASEGAGHVEELVRWLDASPEKAKVAADALARIKSDLGVSVVLSRLQDQPFENVFASNAAMSSPKAAREFVIDRLANGTRQHKLNALLITHHLEGPERIVPGTEHPLLASLLQASHDADEEVREEATKRFPRFAYNAEHPEGRKALRRLVELMRDPASRVRQEAATQASDYPSPEVLELLKKMAADDQDPRVRDSASRAAKSLTERLRNLAQTGHKLVYLRDPR
jgi:HEAT repeat protein